MADYELSDGGVTRRADGAGVPNADGNRDWREYKQWLTDGNTPDPMPPYVPAVQDVNRATLTERAAAQVPDHIAAIDDMNVLLVIPKADVGAREIRQLAKEVKRLHRDLVQIVRIVGNVLDSIEDSAQ